MKTKFVTHSIILSMFLLACQQDAPETADNSAASKIFNKNVGARIPTEAGLRWMELYKKQFTGARAGQSYKITTPMLESMLQSTLGIVGLSFHHATDQAGVHHIITVPIDQTLRIWTSSSQRVLVDANTNTAIGLNVARSWIENYKNDNPSSIWFHFFGTNIFEEIRLSTEFNIEEAMNDEGIPQLLLVVWNGNLGGRTESEAVMIDASHPCPPCATIDYE